VLIVSIGALREQKLFATIPVIGGHDLPVYPIQEQIITYRQGDPRALISNAKQ